MLPCFSFLHLGSVGHIYNTLSKIMVKRAYYKSFFLYTTFSSSQSNNFLIDSDFNTICIKKNDNGHEPDLSMNTSQPDAQNSSYVDPDQDEITIVVPEFEAMGVERPCNVFFESNIPVRKAL